MKLKMLFAGLLACASVSAQTADDPVIMTVNGVPVLRSEFEYSFNKNNSEGVIDKKSVEEYVDLFINYKLKVAAALDAKYDTLQSFQAEFAQYRDQQVLPAFVTDADMEAEAHKIYDQTVEQIGPDGLIQVAHILIMAKQQAPQSEWDAAKVRIDSIYQALKNGADFAELAKKVSEANNLTIKDASTIIDSALNIIMDTVASGEEVQLFGFGSFSVKHRDERQGRNPATGEAMTIAASNTPVFKAAKAFKDKV